MALRKLALTSIRTDGDTQPRAALNMVMISEYREALHEGAAFPPVTVFFDGSDHWLADGFHRYGAYEREGFEEIPADVREGTQQDAQWFAYGANTTHGLHRSNADKERAVKAALLHPNGAGKSNVEIARHCGVAEGTVRNHRAELEASSQIAKMPDRKVTRGGQTYEQDTTNIGKSRPTVSTFTPEPDYPIESDEPEAPDDPGIDDEWARETPDEVFQQADFYALPATDPVLPRAVTIVSIDQSPEDDPGDLLDAVIERNPEFRDRIDTAVLVSNFARVQRFIGEHLLCLNAELLGQLESDQSGYAARAFVRDVRSWLDRFEAGMQGNIRAVK